MGVWRDAVPRVRPFDLDLFPAIQFAAATPLAILISVYRTLGLRNLDPLGTIVQALREPVRTGQLPPLPRPVASDGGSVTYR